MLWLLGTICVLLGLLLFMAKQIYERLWKILDVAGAMRVHLDSISNSVRQVPSTSGWLRKHSQELQSRSEKLDHLEDIPEILRHLIALRELTYGRQKTEHDSFSQWPSISPLEEFQESLKMRRAAMSKGKPDQPSTDDSKP
jgi:hypothetical protein